LGAGRHNEFLTAILSQVGRKTAPWPPIAGAIHAGVLSLGDLPLHDARATLSVHGSRLTIASLDAAALGGVINIAGNIEAAGDRPGYSLDLHWSGVNVAQAATIFHEKWGAGTMSGSASLTLSGYSTSDLASSAHGTFQWDWVNGAFGLGSVSPGAPAASDTALAEATSASLQQASISGPHGAKFSPAHFSRWRASGTVTDGTLQFDSADGANPVTGNIGFDRQLDLVWPGADNSKLRIRGTLAHPTLESSQPASEQ
jgi:hypothetical protein